MGEAVDRYGIGDMWVEDITIVAVWDVGDEEAARALLVENVLQIDDDRLDLLQARRRVAGAAHLAPARRHVAGVRRRADALRAVEGLHPARRRRRRTTLADVAALREAADAVHEFLLGPLAAFMMARARR